MTPMRFFALLIAASSPAAVAADGPKYTLKRTNDDPPSALAQAIRKLLPATRELVVGADGNEVAELWIRDEIPSKATEDQVKNGLTYRELPDGVLLGAVRFPKSFVDYRKQEIPAGVYTLRFAVQPETGDHMGTAPHPEFALLIPATADTDPEPLEGKSLHKLSAKVTGGDHPGVMLLFPNFDQPGEPKLRAEKDGAISLALHRTVVAGEAKAKLGFALTVSGWSKSR
jgi:hypothetical protein